MQARTKACQQSHGLSRRLSSLMNVACPGLGGVHATHTLATVSGIELFGLIYLMCSTHGWITYLIDNRCSQLHGHGKVILSRIGVL